MEKYCQRTKKNKQQPHLKPVLQLHPPEAEAIGGLAKTCSGLP
jgi:hypothetical protein